MQQCSVLFIEKKSKIRAIWDPLTRKLQARGFLDSGIFWILGLLAKKNSKLVNSIIKNIY
jgi:hypothetical protein